MREGPRSLSRSHFPHNCFVEVGGISKRFHLGLMQALSISAFRLRLRKSCYSRLKCTQERISNHSLPLAASSVVQDGAARRAIARVVFAIERNDQAGSHLPFTTKMTTI